VPILQGHTVTRELHVANGMPDWSVTLDLPGLRYAAGEEPATVEVAEPAGLRIWRRCPSLPEHGPHDDVYEMDAKAGQITFGNNVNGRIPPAASQVLVSYAVSDGAQGGVARNRKWQVAGFAGSFGVNLDAVVGGAAASGMTDDRREARRRSRQDHGLVSDADIVAAALSIPLLEVGRAWVVPHDAKLPRTGVVTLVAMRRRPGQEEPEQIPETRRWLDAVRRQLAPRMPLGTRLAVVAPRYADFAVRAQVEAVIGRDPAAVVKTVTEQLRRRLALVDASAGVPLRQPGVPVTKRDVAAWLRAAESVERVIGLQLQRADGSLVNEIRVSASGLPRQLEGRNTIDVVRRSPGSAS
jgi:predicted phage baseplate assembly protein